VSKAYLAPRLRRTPAVLELAAAVCARSAAAGVEVLTIDVREGTKAHRVWTHLGFTTWASPPTASSTTTHGSVSRASAATT